MAELKVAKREGKGKYVAFNMRKEGFLPGVLYGEGVENINMKISRRELEHLMHSGERLVDLNVDGETHKAILKEVQYGTFDHDIMHVDFHAVRLDKPVHVSVEVALVGDSKGVAEGGMIEHAVHEVNIECLPLALPEKIELDISDLGVGDVWTVAKLPVVDGVTYQDDAETVLVSCHMPAGEEEPTEAGEGEEGAEPEVIGEKKDEDEG